MNFTQILGKEPYPHQLETSKALKRGVSVILRAPTGSGKSEAVFVPFLIFRGKSLPQRMLYSLPMRSLTNSLAARFKGICPDLEIKVQHGKQKENLFFEADCIVATLDQIISSYACAPLSLPVRYGNIPAGAVAGSFLIFDEIHTFAPRLGLQCCLFLAERMSKLDIPFVIMSATLPTRFIEAIAKRLKAQVIEADEAQIPVRLKRKVTLNAYLNEHLDADKVLKFYEKSQGKMMVVVNTVDRAIKLYQDLKGKVEPPLILSHSRFFDVDREQKENMIVELFGKKEDFQAILIATQVVEVGLDISCDLMLSELSPIDSLIQRAGRCARQGGSGQFVVFAVPHNAPYDESLMYSTQKVINKRNGSMLTWKIEKDMVDEVLEEFFEKFSQVEAGSRAFMFLSTAAFKGCRRFASRAVREEMSIEVSIYDDPKQLGNKVLMLPTCRVHPYSLKKLFDDKNIKPLIWKIEVDRNYENDYFSKVEVIPVKSYKDIIVNNFYIISPDFAAYDPEVGLRFLQKGEAINFKLPEREFEIKFNDIPYETWREHARRVIEAFERYILPEEEYTFRKLASWLQKSEQELKEFVRLVLAIHDLGKLNEDWQKAAGARSTFLAHSGKKEVVNLPIHAPVTAYVLGDYFKKQWGPILGDSAYFALAHHHSVRAAKVPRYRLQPGWYEEVNKVLNELVEITLPYENVKKFEIQDSSTCLHESMPAFEKEKKYTTYILLSRWLRLADRKALEIAQEGSHNKEVGI